MKLESVKLKNLLVAALFTSLCAFGCSKAVQVAEKPMTPAERELAAERAAAEARAKAESDAAAIAMQEEEGVKVKKKKAKTEKTAAQKAAEERVAAEAKAKRKEQQTKKAVWAGGVVVDDKANGNGGAAQNKNLADPDEANMSREQFESMYGVPTVNYIVKGKVVNSSGKPIEGMQVILANENLNITPQNVNLMNDSIRSVIEQSADTTKSDGTFKVKVENIATAYMRVFVRDIDGPSHGNWENQVINVVFDESDTKDTGHGWRAGTKQKKLTIKAKPRR